MQSDEQNKLEGRIAIVGMACRLPGARNINEYWNNLLKGLETGALLYALFTSHYNALFQFLNFGHFLPYLSGETLKSFPSEE